MVYTKWQEPQMKLGILRPLEPGDYVLATKYSDGDPGDWWWKRCNMNVLDAQ